MSVETRQQLWKDIYGNLVEKEAELAGTYDMPHSPPPSEKYDRGQKKTVIKKTAELEDDLLKQAFAITSVNTDAENPQLETNEKELHEAQPPAHPQAKLLKPTVDVSSSNPPKLLKEKKAERYAMPSLGRYPLDAYDQVKTASEYFDVWHKRMSPEMRREYCLNLVKRANELNISVSPLAERYGSEHYASRTEIKIALDARRTVLLHEEDVFVLDKLAAEQPRLLPETFAATLREFDHANGLDEFYDGDVPDPYFSTFAKVAKTNQESEVSPEGAILIGNEYIPKRKLVEFAKSRREHVKDRFGEDFAEEFVKDPLGIFESLPRDQKLVMLRMANSGDSLTQGASAS